MPHPNHPRLSRQPARAVWCRKTWRARRHRLRILPRAGQPARQAGGGAKFIINPGREPEACFRCHLPTRAEFQLPAHHPVIEGHMNCVQCHDPHGANILKPAVGGLAMARMNENCAQCHREQTRPVCLRASRHARRLHDLSQPARLHQSHDAHAGRQQPVPPLPRADPGTGRAARRSFHRQHDPHARCLQMGTCWAAGCHTAVHGSNMDPRLRY